MIQGDLDAAAKSREEANKDREIAAAGIDAAKQQANEIVSAAKREGEEERARIIEQAKAEAVEIITKGKGVVESERRHAMAELLIPLLILPSILPERLLATSSQ